MYFRLTGLKQPVLMPFPVHPVHAIRNYEQHLDNYREVEKKNENFFFREILMGMFEIVSVIQKKN